jgi:hypothetical protein
MQILCLFVWQAYISEYFESNTVLHFDAAVLTFILELIFVHVFYMYNLSKTSMNLCSQVKEKEQILKFPILKFTQLILYFIKINFS